MNLQEKIKNGWEISAEGYSRIVQDDFVSPGREIWTELILEKAPRAGRLDILDVGTGPGVFATILTLAGHHVTGIDVSPKMLEQAQQNAARYGVSPRFLLMNSQDLTFSPNSFDLIVSRNVMWIMEHPERAYESWLRALRPGGRMVVFDIGHDQHNFLTEFDHNNAAYIQEYTARFGVPPRISFAPEQYEAARGWKRELKLTYETRPEWDVEVLQKLGCSHVTWDNVALRTAYHKDPDLQEQEKLLFRLCADKP